jgi:serine/threonine-protein kinase
VTEPNRVDEVVGGKYRIVRFLASGGMGSVYEAHHTVVHRRFAVKFLHHDLALRRELLARFQREAEAAGALESEHVAAAVDFGIAADGAPYIVFEYLGGESLEHLLEREGRLPIERATHLVQQACRGIQAAHAAGIVHRDLKPHNLFVSRREDGADLLKVLDFGVAKLEFLEKSDAATRTGTVLGTPSYMSPEQARGEKNVDHLSDVYALGAILYELLSGKKPHPGDSHNAILHHIATQPALPLARAQQGLPDLLAAIVDAALAHDPVARPESAEALAVALAPWARAEVWPAGAPETSAPRHAEPSTTLLAPAEPPSVADSGSAAMQVPFAAVQVTVPAPAGSGGLPPSAAPEKLGMSSSKSRSIAPLGIDRRLTMALAGAAVVVVLLLARAPRNAGDAVEPALVRASANQADATTAPESVAAREPATTLVVAATTIDPATARPSGSSSERTSPSAAAQPDSSATSGRPPGRPGPPVASAEPLHLDQARKLSRGLHPPNFHRDTYSPER